MRGIREEPVTHQAVQPGRAAQDSTPAPTDSPKGQEGGCGRATRGYGNFGGPVHVSSERHGHVFNYLQGGQHLMSSSAPAVKLRVR
jgi:hypothetical protein